MKLVDAGPRRRSLHGPLAPGFRRVATAVLSAVAAVAIGVAGSAVARQSLDAEALVVTCPGVSFSFAFDPQHGVVVRGGGRQLATASLASASWSGACHPVASPRWSGEMAEPRYDIYRHVTIRCQITPPLRVYLRPAIRRPASRRNILITAGDPMVPVIGAVLARGRVGPGSQRKNFVYRNPARCRRA